MRIPDGFVMNKVGSQYVVVPVGQASEQHRCMITLNDTGAFLWRLLSAGSEENANDAEDALACALQAEYDVSADVARSDVAMFLESLRSAGLLVE